MDQDNTSVKREVIKGASMAFVLGILVLIGLTFLTLGRALGVPIFLSIPIIAALFGGFLGWLSARKMYKTIILVMILFFACIVLFSGTLGQIITQQFPKY